MNITREAIILTIGIISLIGGGFAWWFARILSERKEDITQTITLKYLSEDIKQIKDELKDVKSKCEHIPIIEEKLKHLKL